MTAQGAETCYSGCTRVHAGGLPGGHELRHSKSKRKTTHHVSGLRLQGGKNGHSYSELMRIWRMKDWQLDELGRLNCVEVTCPDDTYHCVRTYEKLITSTLEHLEGCGVKPTN